MVLSQKSEYAARAVLELAKRYGTGPVKAAQVAEAQHIPVRFLENILNQLRQAGIVESIRGKEGGYRLSRPPKAVSMGEVLHVIQGPVSDIGCADADSGAACALRLGCVLLPVWERAHKAMMEVFDQTDFQNLVEKEIEADARQALDYVI